MPIDASFNWRPISGVEMAKLIGAYWQSLLIWTYLFYKRIKYLFNATNEQFNSTTIYHYSMDSMYILKLFYTDSKKGSNLLKIIAYNSWYLLIKILMWKKHTTKIKESFAVSIGTICSTEFTEENPHCRKIL